MDKITARIIELLFGLCSIVGFGIWLIYSFQNQAIPIGSLFLHYGFFLFIGSSFGLILTHLYNWKNTIDSSEDIIYEIVVYRAATPITALANKLGISRDEVFELLQSMIVKSKIVGEIREDIYYSKSVRTPICMLCGDKIEDSLRLIVCPFCRKPFHKDHIIGYIKDKEEACPNCHRILTLAELFLE